MDQAMRNFVQIQQMIGPTSRHHSQASREYIKKGGGVAIQAI